MERKFLIPLCRELFFDSAVLLGEAGIGGEHIVDLLEGAEDSGVVASAYHFADADHGEGGELMAEVHGCLTCLDNLLLAALRIEALHIDTECLDDEVDDVLAGDDLRLNLDDHSEYARGEILVDGAIEGDGMGEERVDDSLEVAHVVGGIACDVLDDVLTDGDALLLALAAEDALAQLVVGTLDFADEAPLEAGEQTRHEVFKLDWRAVAGHHELLAQLVQVVEDVEERVLRRDEVLAGKLLDVVDDEHVDALVEVDEVVQSVLTHGIGVLHLELIGGDVEHALGGVVLEDLEADGLCKVRLADTTGSEDEEGVECRIAGTVADSEAGTERELVGLAGTERAERAVGIEMRLEIGFGCGFDAVLRVELHRGIVVVDIVVAGLDDTDAVLDGRIGSEDAPEGLGEKVVVLVGFERLIDIVRGNEQGEPAVLELARTHRSEEGLIGVLVLKVFAYDGEALFPLFLEWCHLLTEDV